MKTLVIVILILVCLLTTPLSLKRVIDRNKGKEGKGWPAHPDGIGGPAHPDGICGPAHSDGIGGTAHSEEPGGATAVGAVQQGAHPYDNLSAAGSFDLSAYLTRSIERIVKDSIRATRDNPAETKFLMSFAASAGKAALRRKQLAEEGEHIPPFLIASITEACNLRCAGCYAHASNSARNATPMDAENWERIFTEAEDLGICFIFLVGGEPLLRREVIEIAGHHPKILFPIITNGILINDAYLELFDRCRNLLPVISIEGEQASTDARRGTGIYDLLIEKMQKLASLRIPFGVSITVTKKNLREVTSLGFVEDLRGSGCQMILYVDYVATGEMDGQLETGESTGQSKLGEPGERAEAGGSDWQLEPDEADRALMDLRLRSIRQAHEDMIVLAFPGDEKAFGGCLAAGRGFFHISAGGNAEPCPFAPYSDTNLRQGSIREALRSGFFARLDASDLLREDHAGGCALSHKGAELQGLLKK